jgi:hypothetical protein
MNIPLDIVEGRNGTFQDIFGRPMVIVFDAKKKVRKNGFISSSNHRVRLTKRDVDARHRDEPTSGRQPLLFVDASTSVEKDGSLQRLVRSHVRKKYTRRESRDCEP